MLVPLTGIMVCAFVDFLGDRQFLSLDTETQAKERLGSRMSPSLLPRSMVQTWLSEPSRTDRGRLKREYGGNCGRCGGLGLPFLCLCLVVLHTVDQVALNTEIRVPTWKGGDGAC